MSQKPASWGAPLQRLDQLWTAVELKLAVWVLVAEIATLTLWVGLKGLASEYSPDGNVIGLIFRAIFTAIVLGLVAHLITRKMSPRTNAIAVCTAAFAGLFLGRLWVTVAVQYDTNLVAWLQSASSVALVGGPRGLVTRLTLLLAMLGASLAASRGKHINIDIATRYVPAKLAAPVAMVGWGAAALVCFAASYGFVDSIAVTKFRAEAFRSCPVEGATDGATEICDTPATERLGVAAKKMWRDFFLLRRQLALDVRALPHVLAGEPYDEWLTIGEWNEWVKEGGWTDHYSEEAVQAILLPHEDPNRTRVPLITEPGTGLGRDLLIRDLDFVLPFGLFVIGLKFLLRILRTLSGHVRVDPNAAHEEEDMKHGHEPAEGGAG